MDNAEEENDEYERQLVELGYTKSPSEILDLVRSAKPINLRFLNGHETCTEFTPGRILGKGKSGVVYDIKEQDLDGDDDGLRVVIKEFKVAEAPRYNNGVYVLSSSLNEIVMSSLFHSFYAGETKDGSYSITFPYFEGFFVCGNKGYAVTEKLEMTMSKFIDSPYLTSDNFRVILFQTFFSMNFLNKEEVVHNDMHAKNIMVKFIGPDKEGRSISYRGTKVDSVKYHCFKTGKKEYTHRNVGLVAKVVDFDFAAKYGKPSIVAEKVYNKRNDDWNLTFRFGRSYDIMTFVAYMIYSVIIKTPAGVTHADRNGRKMSSKEWIEIQRTVESVVDYIVQKAEKTIGPIEYRQHIQRDGGRQSVTLNNPSSRYYIGRETSATRSNISKFMDMVAIPMYRPYERYCHLNLAEVLDVDAFRFFTNKEIDGSTYVLGSM